MTEAIPFIGKTTDATARDWLAIAGGMVGCFMAILDIQITNSSLAQIEGAIGASVDEGSWIATAYLIAEIIVIPLTGWLSTVFGLQRYLSVSTMLFVGFSVACAWSTSLPELILFRAGQGFTGGALIPAGITIINRHLPPRQQTVGMAIFGVGVTFAPALGPTIGGWLTENLSWHYIFYLNIIPGIVAIALQLYGLHREKMQLSELVGGDWWGVITMAVGLGAATVVLEEGQRREWFGSPLIRDLTLVAVISLLFFLIIEFTMEKPVINLRLLGRRAVGGGNFMSGIIGAVSYGSIFLVPVYLAQVPRYSAMQIGAVVMWSGLPQLLIFPLMPFLMARIPPRPMVATGSLIIGISCFLNANLTADTSGSELMLPQALRAIGFPLFAIPLMTLATTGLPPRDSADASSLTNIFRNLGGSIGIALLAALTQSREQVHFAALAERVSANADRTSARMEQLTGLFMSRSGDAGSAHGQAVAMLAGQVHHQAMIMAYSDAFTALGYMMLFSIGSVFILPKGKPGGAMARH
ncbi:MAG: Drug resistance transporter, EmrB/QacA subfamily [Rhodospirillales bacterium]|nr:Drug resistance transporter, EmrB/QacA subfamily [Rhodospirillales bacterium]